MRIEAALAALCVVLGALALSPASTRDGVYSESQAARGQASYKKYCASCHGEMLHGSGAATPPLAGQDFIMDWVGQTLDDLFEKMQTSMPADHPGTLARSDNADILAYILKVNEFPEGREELSSEAEALKQIQFEAAK